MVDSCGPCETAEFTGHVLWALYNDPNLMALTGRTLIGAEMALQYGLKDDEGRQPPSYRETFQIAPPAYSQHVIR